MGLLSRLKDRTEQKVDEELKNNPAGTTKYFVTITKQERQNNTQIQDKAPLPTGVKIVASTHNECDRDTMKGTTSPRTNHTTMNWNHYHNSGNYQTNWTGARHTIPRKPSVLTRNDASSFNSPKTLITDSTTVTNNAQTLDPENHITYHQSYLLTPGYISICTP